MGDPQNLPFKVISLPAGFQRHVKIPASSKVNGLRFRFPPGTSWRSLGIRWIGRIHDAAWFQGI